MHLTQNIHPEACCALEHFLAALIAQYAIHVVTCMSHKKIDLTCEEACRIYLQLKNK